ncbi:tetratricopeptide repeat protein [Limoniibacter endophyticus]|uniref:TolB-like protein n=1 Tax=Limoniibacter endophyticus TaxID=1565040 RepID=A0A8J3DGY7_9HYPH|nr:tetratricopeptide repeat protein [Limoniibacter endophyticus]GHC65454.1 hypothetical protein GCM10010136_08160 [Limoniibacter endophyticus]
MTDRIPSANEIGDALQKVLTSTIFSRSERARHLLKHLVDKEQAGETDQLKGFCLAIDVFGRSADFDPASDAVVRVQMGRLRDLVVQYYADEGRGDPVQIILSRGTYVPSYKYNVAAHLQPEDEPASPGVAGHVSAAGAADGAAKIAFIPPEATEKVKRRSMFALAAIAVGAIAVAMALSPGLDKRQASSRWALSPIEETGSRTLYMLDDLPTVTLIAPDKSKAVQTVAMTLRRAISSFDTLSFKQDSGSGVSTGRMDFHVRLLNWPQGNEVIAELVYGPMNEVLFSRSFAYALSQKELNDRVASMMTETGPATGAIYRFLENRRLTSGVTYCISLNDAFYQMSNQTTFDAAYRCLTRAMKEGSRSPLVLSELSALIAKSVVDGYAKDDDLDFDDAVAMARKAVLRGPTSPYAHRAYGFVHAMLGQRDISEFWMKRAYELNIFDLSMAAAYGYSLINSGKYEEGKKLLGRSLIYSSAHPAWWEYSYFVGSFMTGDWTDAYNVSQLMKTSDRPRHIAAVIIMAHRNGDEEMVRRYLRKLETVEPHAIQNPELLFAPDDTRRETALLVEALREAGTGVLHSVQQ